jgi:hypothetical protein
MNKDDWSSYLINFKNVNSRIDKKKKFKLAVSIPELNAYLINHYLDRVVDSE